MGRWPRGKRNRIKPVGNETWSIRTGICSAPDGTEESWFKTAPAKQDVEDAKGDCWLILFIDVDVIRWPAENGTYEE